MADKKKKKRGKGQTKAKSKESKELNPLAYEIIGVVLIAFAMITFFELGIVGQVVYNISLFLLGNLHFFVPFLCILIAGMLMVRRRGVKLNNRIIVGLVLIVASFTIFSHSMLFEQLHKANLLLNDSVLRETWRILVPSEGIINRNHSLGGGMIGAMLFSMMHVLFGATGAKIAAVVLLIIGTILITGKALVPILVEKSPSFKINFRWRKRRKPTARTRTVKKKQEEETAATVAPVEYQEPVISAFTENVEQSSDVSIEEGDLGRGIDCLLYTSPSPRDRQKSRMPSSA